MLSNGVRPPVLKQAVDACASPRGFCSVTSTHQQISGLNQRRNASAQPPLSICGINFACISIITVPDQASLSMIRSKPRVLCRSMPSCLAIGMKKCVFTFGKLHDPAIPSDVG